MRACQIYDWLRHVKNIVCCLVEGKKDTPHELFVWRGSGFTDISWPKF